MSSVKAAYSIDEDIGSWSYDLTGHYSGYYGFLCPMYVIAEGNTLAELFDDLTVFTCGKDGEEGPQITYEDLPGDLKMRVRKLVIQHYVKQVNTLKGDKIQEDV